MDTKSVLSHTNQVPDTTADLNPPIDTAVPPSSLITTSHLLKDLSAPKK